MFDVIAQAAPDPAAVSTIVELIKTAGPAGTLAVAIWFFLWMRKQDKADRDADRAERAAQNAADRAERDADRAERAAQIAALQRVASTLEAQTSSFQWMAQIMLKCPGNGAKDALQEELKDADAAKK